MVTRPKADIAQLVEQRIRNAKVVGSTPIIAPVKSITYTKLIALNFLHGTDLGQRCQKWCLFA